MLCYWNNTIKTLYPFRPSIALLSRAVQLLVMSLSLFSLLLLFWFFFIFCLWFVVCSFHDVIIHTHSQRVCVSYFIGHSHIEWNCRLVFISVNVYAFCHNIFFFGNWLAYWLWLWSTFIKCNIYACFLFYAVIMMITHNILAFHRIHTNTRTLTHSLTHSHSSARLELHRSLRSRRNCIQCYIFCLFIIFVVFLLLFV